jgi:hypothetical protein
MGRNPQQEQMELMKRHGGLGMLAGGGVMLVPVSGGLDEWESLACNAQIDLKNRVKE